MKKRDDLFFEMSITQYRGTGFFEFRVGTCRGLWRSTNTHYEILAVYNSEKGNGHFKKALWYFEQSCRRDDKKLMIRECWNPWLAYQCWRHGYRWIPLFNWERSFPPTGDTAIVA